MKILIVCSGNQENFKFEINHAFVFEQIEAIKKIHNIKYDTYLIKGKWFTGYLKNLKALKEKIRNYSPDLVHAHFGLSGMLACLQRKVPVIITFHGSDANIFKVKILSLISAKLSRTNIFVSEKIKSKISENNNDFIVPCGINLDTFYPIESKTAREKLKFDEKKKYILFSSSFDNVVKNSPLAFTAIKKSQINCELVELKNKNREEVNLLLNACNLLLLTSFSEGSPQVIKEAMACNCPIVASDVGDIREVIGDTAGCYITSFNPEDVAEKIKLALQFNGRTDGREKIKHFDNKLIAEKIFNLYSNTVKNKI